MPKVSKVSSIPKKTNTRPPDRPIEREQPEKYFCTRCGKSFVKQKGNFTISRSPLYCGNNHYVTVCNRCIDDLYNFYRESVGNNKEAMRRICEKFDLYWSENAYALVEKRWTNGSDGSRVRAYISKLNMIIYSDKTFDDTLDEEEIARLEKEKDDANLVTLTDVAQPEKAPEGPTEEMIRKWGPGFPNDMYSQLEARYRYWTGETDEALTREERALYIQISQMEVLIQRAAANGEAVDKYVNTLNNLLGSANLKPSQKKDEADEAFDGLPLGMGIKIYEEARPIPKPLPGLEDCDHLVKYITVWFLGHLQKMLGIKGRYNKMYEEEIARLRVERPDMADEDEEDLIGDIFGEEHHEQ